jgi:hypothetical protein
MMLVMSGLRMQAHSARVDVAQTALRAGLDFMTRDLLSASAGMSSGSLWVNGTAINTISLVGGSNSNNGTDVLDLYLADSTFGYATVYANVALNAGSISVDTTSPFAVTTPQQTVLLTDLINGIALNVSAITTPSGSPPFGTLSVSGTGAFPPNVSSYNTSNAFVFPLRHVRYSVGQCFAGTANNNYAIQTCLMMDVFDGNGPQPLAEGVEDLQIAFGYDNNGDGNIVDSASTSDEWYGNAAGDIFPATLTNLKAVRITIIATSTMAENIGGVNSVRPQAEDHAPTTTPDGFFRRVISSRVSIRNFNI